MKRRSTQMGAQLRWLERTPDKREVGGSSPLVPTKGAKASGADTLVSGEEFYGFAKQNPERQ